MRDKRKKKERKRHINKHQFIFFVTNTIRK